MMNDHPLGTRTSFLDKLTAITQDPAVRGLALRRAGTPDLAEDALQSAFCAVAQTQNPQSIRDLRAFFRKALILEINHELTRSTPAPVEDICAVSDRYGNRTSWPADVLSTDFESELHILLQVEEWLARFRSERNKLAASVPRRSTDPDRYRAVVVAAAERILRLATEGNVDTDDWSAILKSQYPGLVQRA